MRGIFCGTTAKNNEEYKKVLKAKMVGMAVVFVIGAFTAIAAFVAASQKITMIPERMLWVYSGAGTGIAAAGLVLFIRFYLLTKNEKKLNEERLKNADERLQQIGNKALRTGLYAMVLVIYAVALIGGIFYPVLIKVLLLVIAVFLATYFISYKLYENKM